jgi:hypothetical protein
VWNASDEALVAGFTTGDGDVARVFVNRFQDRVYGLALAITRDRQAAQEVAQDAFLRAWRYGASYDPRQIERYAVPDETYALRIERSHQAPRLVPFDVEHDSSWGATLDVDPDSITSVAVVDSQGHVWCEAEL